MSPAHLGNERSDHVITDFVHTFERRQHRRPATSWREIVEDSYSIFHSFSYLIEHLFSLIDSAMPCQTFIIKGLTLPQRRDFYLELSEIGIHFTKNRYIDDNLNQCTDICISTTNLWSVPDYRTNPELAIYQHRINVFNAFYTRVDNLLTTHAATNGNIIVSLENFLKFKRIFADALGSLNHQREYINYFGIGTLYVIENIYPSLIQPEVANTASQPCVSSNTIIKHQLADLIFDIKDDLRDCVYREILEKIALISP